MYVPRSGLFANLQARHLSTLGLLDALGAEVCTWYLYASFEERFLSDCGVNERFVDYTIEVIGGVVKPRDFGRDDRCKTQGWDCSSSDQY